MGNGRKAEDSDRFWDEAVQKRMEDVLSKNRANCLKYLREQNEILDTLDEETRTKFERFVESLYEMVGAEYEQVYRAGLSDGVRLRDRVILHQ